MMKTMKQEGRASTISRLLEMIGTPRLRGLLLLLFTAGIVCWWWCNLYYAPRDMVEWLEDSNVNVESSPSSSNNQIGILYLYVDSWAEGVSSWMVSISELLIVAKALNATLVEPCIRRGRLVNCQDPAEWNMKLTEVFDVHKMKEYHPHLISHADFLDQTRDVAATANSTVAVVYQVCHSKPKWEKKHCEEQLERQFDVKISSTLERAIEASKTHNTVLQMTSYWREGFSSMEHCGKPFLPDKSNRYVNQIKFKYLHFKQEYFSLIDAMLQDAGIKNDDFSMIQWRGEAMKLDFVTCANHIVTARNIMNAAARTNSTPFVQGRAIEHVLNRKLVFDYCAYKKQAYSLCPCDLKGCYDRIVHSAASLALQRIGISQAKITSMFGTIQQLIHKIRTVFGDSQDS